MEFHPDSCSPSPHVSTPNSVLFDDTKQQTPTSPQVRIHSYCYNCSVVQQCLNDKLTSAMCCFSKKYNFKQFYMYTTLLLQAL